VIDDDGGASENHRPTEDRLAMPLPQKKKKPCSCSPPLEALPARRFENGNRQDAFWGEEA
jgi:hypothetical protein